MAAVAVPFLGWQDSWRVGVRAIDEQHQNLVSLLNQLHEAMRSGRGNTVMGEILAKLISYTKAHFATEEELMQTHGYPEFLAHRAEHHKLTAKVLAFQKEFSAGKVGLSIEVVEFLSGWLKGHILGTD